MSTRADSTGDRPVDEQRPSRPLVVAANRLPVMRGADGDWEPSPGGLVRALLPMLRRSGGSWVGWTGDVDDDPAPFSVDGVELYPVAISQAEHDDYYEGFANDSLWPLYHDAVRDSTFRRGNGTPTSPSTSASPTDSPRSPRRARSSGCTTTTCSSCRR